MITVGGVGNMVVRGNMLTNGNHRLERDYRGRKLTVCQRRGKKGRGRAGGVGRGGKGKVLPDKPPAAPSDLVGSRVK